MARSEREDVRAAGAGVDEATRYACARHIYNVPDSLAAAYWPPRTVSSIIHPSLPVRSAASHACALGHIATRYDDELTRSVKMFTTVLEPVLMVLMAAVVGFIAVSMLMAVFEMTNGLDI